MLQFTVPQFIDTEDKIIGPITTRQFLILLVCFMIIAIFYKLFDFSLFITSSLIWFAICGTIAFARINGRPFHYFILNFIQTIRKPGLRIWNNQEKNVLEEREEEASDTVDYIAIEPEKLGRSRLSELALVVDTAGAYQANEQ